MSTRSTNIGETRPALGSIGEPARFASGDLRKRITTGRLVEGANVVDIDDDRVALTAIVRDGSIVAYEFTDASGVSIPSTVATQKGLDDVEECFICRRKGNTITCKKIPCV